MFSICIMILFVMGLVLGSGRCVYASWVPQDRRWHYLLQAGVGLPAAPAALQWYFEKQVNDNWLGGWMARPTLDQLSEWQRESGAGFDLGNPLYHGRRNC